MSESAAAPFRVRVLTQNLWHGLDHTKPLLMPPAENPLSAWLRRGALLRGLRLLRHPEARLDGGEVASDAIHPVLDVFCLQELNPLGRRLRQLAGDLDMRATGKAANVGVRVGPLSYPPLLEEGVGVLWAGPATSPVEHAGTISGRALEATLPLGAGRHLEIGAHFAERRVFCAMDCAFAGQRWLFVNTHLHSGSPRNGAATRRGREIEALLDWLLPRMPGFDAVVLCGDFNAEAEHPEMQRLAGEGFVDLVARDEKGEALATWDPFRNALCRRSAELSRHDDAHYAWDTEYHRFDHIWLWTRRTQKWEIRVDRIFDDPSGNTWVSDHFGLLATIVGK